MRSVRCDSCGMKAMLAASQCPHCGHLFELRDGFGEMLPLAHCATCDSYYPARQGTCRWCGSEPERFRIAPYAFKGVGALAFAGLLGGAWLVNRSPEVTEKAEVVGLPTKSTRESLTTRVDSGLDFQPPVLAGIQDTASEWIPSPPASMSTAVEGSDAGQAGPSADQQSPALLGAAEVAPARPAAPRKASARPSRSSTARWVRATARRWVTVRASASPRSRVIASIGPDTRVQLGESRGEWRRIRMKGISGWVERSKF